MGMLGWFKKKGATELEEATPPSPGEGEAMIVFGGLNMH